MGRRPSTSWGARARARGSRGGGQRCRLRVPTPSFPRDIASSGSPSSSPTGAGPLRAGRWESKGKGKGRALQGRRHPGLRSVRTGCDLLGTGVKVATPGSGVKWNRLLPGGTSRAPSPPEGRATYTAHPAEVTASLRPRPALRIRGDPLDAISRPQPAFFLGGGCDHGPQGIIILYANTPGSPPPPTPRPAPGPRVRIPFRVAQVRTGVHGDTWVVHWGLLSTRRDRLRRRLPSGPDTCGSMVRVPRRADGLFRALT